MCKFCVNHQLFLSVFLTNDKVIRKKHVILNDFNNILLLSNVKICWFLSSERNEQDFRGHYFSNTLYVGLHTVKISAATIFSLINETFFGRRFCQKILTPRNKGLRQRQIDMFRRIETTLWSLGKNCKYFKT